MTRRFVVILLLAAGAVGLGFDLAASEPPNPFTAPPAFALGSGLSAGGAHCASPAGG